MPIWNQVAHNLLSTTHLDTTAGTVTRGATITGQTASPTWKILSLGASGKILRSDGTDLLFSTATFPNTVTSGDVLIATGANAIGSLAIGATGTIIRSTGTAPAYTTATYPNTVTSGDVIIATGANAIGSLAVGAANTIVRSTGTAPAYSTATYPNTVTAGSVLFATGTNAIGENNANFFWDNTNNRLGIATALPNQPLHVVGNINFTGNLFSGGTQGILTGDVRDLQVTTPKIANSAVTFAKQTIDRQNAVLGGAVNFTTTSTAYVNVSGLSITPPVGYQAAYGLFFATWQQSAAGNIIDIEITDQTNGVAGLSTVATAASANVKYNLAMNVLLSNLIGLSSTVWKVRMAVNAGTGTLFYTAGLDAKVGTNFSTLSWT